MFINNLCYEASAGSGKTFMLVVRYLSLLFQGASPSKILALTFTNKAASEMSERIVLTLEELESRGELGEIARVTSLSEEYLLENRQGILSEFLNSHTKIMTIDSFFTSILRKFSLYTSLMPDFSTFSSQHELKLLAQFLKEVRKAGKRDTLITLSLQSKKRLNDIFSLLDEFYVKSIELKGLSFIEQDYQFFENTAMDNLLELKKLINSCKGASATVKKAVEAESFDELAQKSWIGRDSLDYRTFSKCFSGQMDVYLKNIQEAVKNQNRAKEQNFFYALTELVDIYKKSKKALYMDDSELSFSDVTSLVYDILNLIDDSEFLYFRLDATIEHMLLDEFQDTSILQYEILKPLINEITSGAGIFENGSFFFVGDVKQSIYRFRGGVSDLFDVVKSEQNTKVEKLLTNYRSQKELVKFVNKVFEKRIKNYSNQLVKDGANGGFVEVIQNDELLDELVKQVENLISLGANVNEIAVLCSTNGDGEAIKECLSAKNIDVVTETTTKLINQKSVKAILEYLKYQYFSKDIYKHNFFSLISMELQDLKKISFNEVKILDIVKKIIDDFSLFKNDFNLIRFLETISKFKDIESLLFEYERLDVSAAASELNGVRVLTVHKSKGLEFEHVIVIDRMKKAPSARDAIIYEYDGIKLQNIYLRIKGRDGVDAQYANALIKEKELVLEDSLNALYVAFTRARDNLFVIKKSKDSIFDILEVSLGSNGKLRCDKSDTVKEKNSFQNLEYKAFCYGVQNNILNLEKESQEDLKSINFGLAMHYMLEMIADFKLSCITQAKDMMLNKYGSVLSNDEVLDIQNRVENLVKNQKFLTLIDGEIHKEKALRYKNNLRYVDLLVKYDEDNWCVIDYKSSTSYSEKHLKQVKYYLKAIKEITGASVKAHICYLLTNEIKLIEVY